MAFLDVSLRRKVYTWQIFAIFDKEYNFLRISVCFPVHQPLLENVFCKRKEFTPLKEIIGSQGAFCFILEKASFQKREKPILTVVCLENVSIVHLKYTE